MKKKINHHNNFNSLKSLDRINHHNDVMSVKNLYNR